MIELADQLGKIVRLEHSAKRIISLVPSQTELLFYLDLDKETVGLTKFCIHPEKWHQSKTRIGGTKNINLELVKELNPDLIIANKEENTKEDIKALADDFNLYISDVNNIEDSYQMIKDVGKLCGKEQQAVDLIDDIQDDFNGFDQISGTVTYFIWNNPYMVCGANTFINSMIEKIGLTNVIKTDRYIEITEDKIKNLNADYIFLSTEPYPFNQSHKDELKKISTAKVIIVDGEMFSWYGSRMLLMKEYFKKLLP